MNKLYNYAPITSTGGGVTPPMILSVTSLDRLALSSGTVALVAGIAVVNVPIKSNSMIFLSSNVDGGAPGWLRVSNRIVNSSFTITSSNAGDASTIAYLIIESEPL